jgi:RNA polymerase sigma factor (sigma-70 family)
LPARFGKSADAEDAFQATFLVLMRKAVSVRSRRSIANWLYGVAYRVCNEALKKNRRRQRREWKVQELGVRDRLDEISVREAREVIDAELSRLSENYRAPLVLCYLEGATRDEAAKQLGWSLATLKRRLDRGRVLLAGRLRRRGLTLPAA